MSASQRALTVPFFAAVLWEQHSMLDFGSVLSVAFAALIKALQFVLRGVGRIGKDSLLHTVCYLSSVK